MTFLVLLILAVALAPLLPLVALYWIIRWLIESRQPPEYFEPGGPDYTPRRR